MRKLFTLLGLAILFGSCGTKPQASSATTQVIKPVTEYGNTITSEELKEMLYKYASDEFEGRETGEKGQKLAVEYLKQQYKSMDIASPLSGDDYFQDVPLEKQKVAEAKITVNNNSFDSFEHSVVLRLSESMDVNVNEVVYVGYGIDSENYSDYKGIDVKGKVVLAKAGEPKDANGMYITSGTAEDTKWTNGRQSISSKRDAAQENGAALFLLLDDALFERYAAFYKQNAESGASGRLSLQSKTPEMAMLMIGSNLAKALNPAIDADASPKTLKTQMSIKVDKNAEIIMSENVVAFIKGTEKPDEIIVISAHLDHEGVKNGEVYNGADDDGSGTIALLEIAEAFKTASNDGNGPKRSILFLHVTGEEKGLLGSRYYTDMDPIFPLENTVADFNIDMIGRIDPKRKEGDRNYVYLIGSDKLSTELHTISEEMNKKYANVELDYTYNDENDPNRFYYRSDHYNFAKNNIPVIFYFNGTHDDYHKPSDTPDKIEYDLLENRARLVFYTAWEVANRPDRIMVDKVTQ